MRDDAKACACVLAAGASRRMGEAKLLLPFAGSTLLERAVRAASGCAASDVAVVTGAYHEEMAPLLDRLDVAAVRNARWESGQASSVGTAARYAEERGCDAVVLLVADQPFVSSLHLRALIDAHDSSEHDACAAQSGDRFGNPCLFDRRCFGALQALQGDEGARVLLRDARLRVHRVRFDDPYLFEDVDEPEDLVRTEAMLRG